MQVSTPGLTSAYELCQTGPKTPAAPQSWFYSPLWLEVQQIYSGGIFLEKCFCPNEFCIPQAIKFPPGYAQSRRLQGNLVFRIQGGNDFDLLEAKISSLFMISSSPNQVPLSASRGKSGYITMLPESWLSKQGLKKARTGIIGWCSLTVRRLHSSYALSRSLVSMTLPSCPHFSRVFNLCPCSLCHLHLWCPPPVQPTTPVIFDAMLILPLAIGIACSPNLVTFRKSWVTKAQKFLVGPYLLFIWSSLTQDPGGWHWEGESCRSHHPAFR